ncbi:MULTISPECIES: hypothetical protein [Micromonospora]|uniref:Uncharacterized protein n=1 Tax=Micromonospora yangpuensis TaxID=683228 RepID=A0A1C6U105_9ACTN|nr:hypothetical protein [Micromonospora yangpuensis]GGM11682.1 hypothetical protein GCM10012279_32240 [Micromonospora yangpuensis]SCL47561.1 hypothetical protein GA0070617_0620 [Micromonospora yangpuensis]
MKDQACAAVAAGKASFYRAAGQPEENRDHVVWANRQGSHLLQNHHLVQAGEAEQIQHAKANGRYSSTNEIMYHTDQLELATSTLDTRVRDAILRVRPPTPAPPDQATLAEVTQARAAGYPPSSQHPTTQFPPPPAWQQFSGGPGNAPPPQLRGQR